MTKKTIFFVGEDPGGVDVLVPIYKRLVELNRPCRIFSRGPGNTVWERHGINFDDLGVILHEETEEGISQLIENLTPAILISSTSFPGRLEKNFRKTARKLGIKSITVLDADRGDHYQKKESDLKERGDFVFTLNDKMTKSLLSANYREEQLIKTGHLGYGQIVDDGAGINSQELVQWKNNLMNSSDSRHLITIFSDNISELFGEENARTKIGFHEKQVVFDIVAQFRRIVETTDLKFEIIIKLHPEEIPGKYQKLITEFSSNDLIIRELESCDAIRLIKASHRIFGIFSIVMVWSALLGKPALSYQPNAIKRDLLETAHLGIAPVVFDETQIASIMKQFIFEDNYYQQWYDKVRNWNPPVDGLEIAISKIKKIA